MIMAKLKSAKGKKFLFGLLAVFIIAASGIYFLGGEEQ